MNCPVCKRTLAATLSICPTCGAMMNDSVREELQGKISSPSRPLSIHFLEEISDDHTPSGFESGQVDPHRSVISNERRTLPVNRNTKNAEEVAEQPADRGGMTREFRGARRTSPILVEFQNKSTALPEWRLQMQNAVRQRREAGGTEVSEKPVLIRGSVATSGATALKAEAMPQQSPEVGSAVLENAVRRMEESRKRFSVHRGSPQNPLNPAPKGGSRTFPLAVNRTAPSVPSPSPEPLPESVFTEIADASSPVLEPVSEKEFDTNRLPELPEPEAVAKAIEVEEAVAGPGTIIEEPPDSTLCEVTSDFDEFADVELEIEDEEIEIEAAMPEAAGDSESEVAAKKEALPLFPDEEEHVEEVAEMGQEVVTAPLGTATTPNSEVREALFDSNDDIHKTTEPERDTEEPVYIYADEYSQGFIDDIDEEFEEHDFEAEEDEEIDDLAPISMRFNAGLLDLIICSGTSLLLLSPFIVTGGKWLSAPGAIAFAVTLAIVMFIYMTASVGFSGRTLGMKVFSLEMIDVEENEYPNFHQAALSSSLYLVSLALGGAGFVTAVFNPERRALHDLLSGTIVVREY